MSQDWIIRENRICLISRLVCVAGLVVLSLISRV